LSCDAGAGGHEKLKLGGEIAIAHRSASVGTLSALETEETPPARG
jgi:hypothetical protein